MMEYSNYENEIHKKAIAIQNELHESIENATNEIGKKDFNYQDYTNVFLIRKVAELQTALDILLDIFVK